MLQVLILKGLPASGKTTWAKSLVKDGQCKRVSKDDLREMFDASVYSKKNESFIIEIRNNLIKKILREGKNVVVDDTNLNPIHEADIRNLVKDFNERYDIDVKVLIKEFVVPVEECIKRDSKREKPVREKVIMDMYNKYLKVNERIEQNPKLPHAIIVDIDGTVADNSHRNPFSYKEVKYDIPFYDIVRLVNLLKINGRKLIFVSGREDICQSDTKEWLDGEFLEPYELFMRKTGDHRKDSIVKKEIFDEHIRDKYYIEYVLDDRDQVVKMWRDLGLTCLQVAEGNF